MAIIKNLSPWRAKPWLLLPPQLAHDLSPWALKACALLRPISVPIWRPFHWRGLYYPNRLGLAGGVDKNAQSVRGWWTFGPGFIELGTVTPQAQGPNPGSIMDRDIKRLALWNRMGFPNLGADKVKQNLKDLGQRSTFATPLWINIGKNRNTPLEKSIEDYIYCFNELHAFADAIVVNISSPNTSGLRELLKPENLKKFLEPLMQLKKTKTVPCLLKISPDLSEKDLQSVLDISASLGVDGWILTNTTLTRETESVFPAHEGGVSGLPLQELSRQALQTTIRFIDSSGSGSRGDRLIVSCGGVLDAEEVERRLDLGADLVQVYTALIFQGPGFFLQVAKDLAR